MKNHETFYCRHSGGIYFRILGYGLTIKKSNSHIKLFSERNGYTKAFYIFGWRIAILKP